MTNCTLVRIIKRRLDTKERLWPEELPGLLWAYRTTARTPTGETPFALAFGVEAAMHVEIRITSYQIDLFDPSNNEEHLRLD